MGIGLNSEALSHDLFTLFLLGALISDLVHYLLEIWVLYESLISVFFEASISTLNADEVVHKFIFRERELLKAIFDIARSDLRCLRFIFSTESVLGHCLQPCTSVIVRIFFWSLQTMS